MFQSGYQENHSTVTALLKVVNYLRIIVDANNVVVLLLLDLSEAFDTLDHNILIDGLEKWVALSERVCVLFRSYLTDRKFFVGLGAHVSEAHGIQYGIPQGSIPILFSLNMLPLGNIIKHHHINYDFYADDTQLHIYVSPNDPNSLNSPYCLSQRY